MSLYGYVRTSTASSSPESQEIQLRQAGVPPERVYRDIAVSGRTGAVSRAGWHTLDSSLVADDVLVVASIDRIGRRWLDTVVSILNLQLRQVRIRTLSEAEIVWARHLDADPDSPEAFFGNVLMIFAAWNAHQEVESISRRKKAGLERARAEGKKLGRPQAMTEEQINAARYLRLQARSYRASGRMFGVDHKTVRAMLEGESG